MARCAWHLHAKGTFLQNLGVFVPLQKRHNPSVELSFSAGQWVNIRCPESHKRIFRGTFFASFVSKILWSSGSSVWMNHKTVQTFFALTKQGLEIALAKMESSSITRCSVEQKSSFFALSPLSVYMSGFVVGCLGWGSLKNTNSKAKASTIVLIEL